jgi:hypothetical protein
VLILIERKGPHLAKTALSASKGRNRNRLDRDRAQAETSHQREAS